MVECGEELYGWRVTACDSSRMVCYWVRGILEDEEESGIVTRSSWLSGSSIVQNREVRIVSWKTFRLVLIYIEAPFLVPVQVIG